MEGRWKYLYRAITKSGKTLDFYLSSTRNAKAAKRFQGKALSKIKDYEKPATIDTDLAPSYDHGKLKRLIKPTLGFKSMKTAFATIKGFEIMRMSK